MPSGASDGSIRCTIALKEALRSEPQIETMFKLAMTVSEFFGKAVCGVATGRSRPHLEELYALIGTAQRRSPALFLVLDGIDEHADALDVDLAGIACLHPHRVRVARVPDARGRAGEDDITRLQRHALGDISDRFGDGKHHVIGIVRLHDLSVEPA